MELPVSNRISPDFPTKVEPVEILTTPVFDIPSSEEIDITPLEPSVLKPLEILLAPPTPDDEDPPEILTTPPLTSDVPPRISTSPAIPSLLEDPASREIDPPLTVSRPDAAPILIDPDEPNNPAPL